MWTPSYRDALIVMVCCIALTRIRPDPGPGDVRAGEVAHAGVPRRLRVPGECEPAVQADCQRSVAAGNQPGCKSELETIQFPHTKGGPG
eukprot:1194718-Prorocentrum_minimum.AAC.13